jgi:hypothetical protein
VKALVRQIAEAVIIQEAAHLLVFSLPTEKLMALHRELSKLGQISALQADAALSAPTTLLRLMFSQPAVSLPPLEQLPSHS